MNGQLRLVILLLSSAHCVAATLEVNAQNLQPTIQLNSQNFQPNTRAQLNNQFLFPNKNTWTLRNGTEFQGVPIGFDYHEMYVWRDKGFLFLNNEQIEKPSDNAVFQLVCRYQGLDCNTNKDVDNFLVRRFKGRATIPFPTLKYKNQSQQTEEVPTVLLHPDDFQSIRIAYDEWERNAKIEYEKRQLETLKVLLMQEQVRALRSMSNALWYRAWLQATR